MVNKSRPILFIIHDSYTADNFWQIKNKLLLPVFVFWEIRNDDDVDVS